jgi:hypothetical protein
MASARNCVPHKSIRHIVVAVAAMAVAAMTVGQICAPASAQSPFRATNPTSSLTLTAGTTPYAAGQLIANSSTGFSVSNPFFVLPPGGAGIARLRLSTNDTTPSAWGGQIIQVDLWSASPTWTNGDHGTWAPATGTGAHLASFICNMSPEYGDGAYAECTPSVGPLGRLPGGAQIYWSLQAITGSGATDAGRTFTLTAELAD